MTRELFLRDLNLALSSLSDEEAQRVLAYYSEMIDDRMEAGMSEEDAVNAMEPVEVIASRVLNEAGMEESKETEETDDPHKEIRRNADAVQELVILAEEQRVRLTTGDTEDVILRYRIDNGDVYQLHEENGVLTLEHKYRPMSSYKLDPKKLTVDNFFDEIGKFIGSINLGNIIHINTDGEPRCIEVVLPRIFKGQISVQTSNARIIGEQITCIGEMKLRTSNSRVMLTHIVAHQADIGTSNARILLEDVYVRRELDAVTSNGRIVAQKTISDDKMHLRTSNASVRVEEVDAKELVMKTSNGNIGGTLRGNAEDYAIHSGTSNGRNNLFDSAEGEKKLTALTSNANIAIEFIG